MRALRDALAADLARPYADGAVSAARPAAFFCAEYAVHQSLPVYSGGLGVLAGDILKAASDLAVPLVAVGLMYRHGYFRQRTDAGGWQHEYWVDTDPDRVPAALVTAGDQPLTISVPISDRQVIAQVWRVNVGRVPLLLLDTNRPENTLSDRFITSRLYVGESDLRLAQYARARASAASAPCARCTSTRPSSTSTRATPPSRRSSWRAARRCAAGSSCPRRSPPRARGRCSRRTRRCRRATTRTRPARSPTCCSARAPSSASTSASSSPAAARTRTTSTSPSA